MERDGQAVSGVQHTWNVTSGAQFKIDGLKAGETYTYVATFDI